MNNTIKSFTAGACILGLASLMTACGTPPRPVEELTRARTLIEQAEQAGAQEFAGADLERAREKLRQADAAADKNKEKEMATARRLAQEAASDAEFAAATARKVKAEQAAQEVATSTQTLKQESSRAVEQKEQQLQAPAQQ